MPWGYPGAGVATYHRGMRGTLPFPMENLLDLMVDMVCVVDPHGRFLYLNRSCEALLGCTPEELLGRYMIELVHPDDRGPTLLTVWRIMQGNPEMHFENRYVRKDGRVVHVMWSARWSEEHQFRVAVGRDVSALREVG